MPTQHRCVRTCHYLQKLWRVGDILELTPGFEDAPPGKHFLPIDGSVDEPVQEHAKTAGDDPRPTTELVRALKSYGVNVSDGMSRKQVFNKLIKFELTDGRSMGDRDAKIVPGTAGGAADPELPKKAVSELSPDEFEKTTAKQMIAMILRDRGHKASVGNSKSQYFDLDEKLAREG